MKDLEAIRLAAIKYDEKIKSGESDNVRLKKLIATHGVEAVSAASGLKVSSLVQYTKTNPPTVSKNTVEKACAVLVNF
mgnify:CR=1 FL=1|tara:strand:- start:360 stop:593 length:234 start_codon:yes stop_codon:yes gene_type:complete